MTLPDWLAWLDPNMIDLSQYDDQLLQNLLIIGGVLSLIIAILIIFRFSFVDALRRFLDHNPVLSLITKLAAVAGMFFLMYSDYYAVNTIFSFAPSLDEDAVLILSITFAAFLEGFAFLLGIFLARLLDPTNFRKSDVVVNLLGVLLTLLPLLGAWVLAFSLRYNNLRLTILENELDESIVTFFYTLEHAPAEELFMLLSPILTSILALGLSWLAFPADNLRSQERTVEYRQGRYLRYRKRYQQYLMRYLEAKSKLWTKLNNQYNADSEEADLPADSYAYHTRCQQLIRQKAVSTCVNAFTEEFGRYNKAIEGEISEYIQELSQRSTLPHIISSITVQEVLERYENEMKRNDLTEDLWDNRELRMTKRERLQKELDNAAYRAGYVFTSRRAK